jgi:hypothetical protein
MRLLSIIHKIWIYSSNQSRCMVAACFGQYLLWRGCHLLHVWYITEVSGTAPLTGHQGPARLNLTLMLYPRSLRDWQGSIYVYAG